MSAFFFASLPNAYDSMIQSYSALDFPSTKPPLDSKRGTRVGILQRVRHLASFSKAKFIDELKSGHIDSSGLFLIFIFPLIL